MADDSRMSAITCHNLEESCGSHSLHSKYLSSPPSSFTTVSLLGKMPPPANSYTKAYYVAGDDIWFQKRQ
jgi:hypothetical protein